MLKFAIVGFGGLGHTHFAGYREVSEKACDKIKLVALCDVNAEAFKTKSETNLGADSSALNETSDYNLYTDVDELLEKEELDFAITALPTYLHSEIGIKIMNKGIHLFSEKPMALSLEQAQAMIDAAKRNNVKLMIGQCLRFWPRYEKLKEIIDSKKYGNVIRAHFSRLSCTPLWSWQNWFLDEAKSGGAALDLHVHDVDFINYVFGMPKSVMSIATNHKTKHDSILTSYEYDDKVVTATGEWGCPTSYGFSATFFVKMENATVEIRDKKLMLFPENGEAEALEVSTESAYLREMLDFISCIKNDKVSEINPPEESMRSLKIALAEKLSADKKQKIVL